jgi:prepilin-type N-terminal cleavage/methylation domain-containing protein/prepilin-type processing-associated H-X9-DG protein
VVIRRRATGQRRGFTLTELLVVVGLISVLISLLLPALGKARAAANSTACLANMRTMGNAWTNYMIECRGRLPDDINFAAPPSELAWTGSCLGILDRYGVRGNAIRCPAASEPIPFLQPNKGFGNVSYAWSGRFMSIGSAARLSVNSYREGSYAYNRYLTSSGLGFNRITKVKLATDVPVFLDAVNFDVMPLNGTILTPVENPPNLRFDSMPLSAPEHWRFLITRHGRGVNAYMVDGSARRVALEDTYMLKWKSDWIKYRLSLPAY